MKHSDLQYGKSLDRIVVLNELIGRSISSKDELDVLVGVRIGNDVRLKLDKVNTDLPTGPVYKYIDSENNIKIYVADRHGEHIIVIVSAGPQTTYFNEEWKKFSKRAVI